MIQTINIDTEVVASRYDPVTRINFYTIGRGGRYWTVQIHSNDLDNHGPNAEARRAHLGNVLNQAMQGKADGE